MSIALRGVTKQFGEFAAVKNIDLDVSDRRADRAARALGLRQDHPAAHHCRSRDTGRGPGAVRRPRRDPVADCAIARSGFVFQHYALFRHMSVFENVAFGLKVKRRRERPAAAEIRKKVQALLELVQLGWARRSLPRAAVGRPEAARGAGARDGSRPEGAAAG